MGRNAATCLTAIVALGTLAACRGEHDMAANAGSYSRQVSRAVPRIERSIGLTFKSPPRVESRNRADVRQFLEKNFAEQLPPEELQGMERAYKRFGLLPDTLDLQRFMLELLTEQVAGYYDPKAKTLYVVDDAPETIRDVTIQHELVHALQDQYLNLDSLQGMRTDNDRLTAAQAVVEGQATLEQLGGVNIATQLPGGWERVREIIREEQRSMPMFSIAPILLQETLLFPYLSGAEFMRRFKQRVPNEVPFGRMPASTEQIMHEEKYFGTADTPTGVTLPATRGKTLYENNLGEFETRLLLYEYLKDQNAAVRGAAGWDGDRYRLVDVGGGREALVWVTVWDNSVDAAEFFDLLDTGLLKKYPGIRPRVGTQDSRTYAAAGRQIQISVSDIGGRPIVMLADAPAGVSLDLLGGQKVTLQE